MQGLNETLKRELQKNGLMVRITSIERVNELEREIARLREQSLLEEGFCNENLRWLDYDYKAAMPGAQSVIVVSKRQYTTFLNFKYKGKSYRVSEPPTYVYSNLRAEVEKILSGVLSPCGFHIKKASLPHKLLAVRTGLGMYGRNNICYIDGMGSFHRIFTFYSDMPAMTDDWQEVKVMPECGSCRACIKACPAKCIDGGRFLIHADRCITRYNEAEGEFPEWLKDSWHNSVVGCMRCQAACPRNRDFMDKADGEVDFTPEETEAILESVPEDLLPDSLKQKLAALDLIEYYGILGRNLAALFAKTV